MKSPILVAAMLAAAAMPAFADRIENPPAGTWEKRSTFLRGRIYHSAVWTYSEMIVWGGGANHEFYNDGAIYDPMKDRWRPMSLTNAPSARWGHAAVWTGSEMIVWGGRSNFAATDNKNDGGIYDPATDTWRAMNTKDAPSARSQMAAVWTGQQLLVWGGFGDGGECPTAGASYDPRTDTWTPLGAENAPEGRIEPAFVWTGSEMIVWGGLLQSGDRSSGTGGRYNPETKSWKSLPMQGAPASARGLQAVWTGSEMIVWGGSHLNGESQINVGVNAGGRYNPRTDSWQPTAVNGAPDGRLYYGAAWTGDELIVWSGGDQKSGHLSSGGIYDPAKNEWRSTAESGAPPGRGIMTAVWAGDGMLVFGGSTGGVPAFNDLHYFRPGVKAVSADK